MPKNVDAFDEGQDKSLKSPALKKLLGNAQELHKLEKQIDDLLELQKRLSGRANELKTKIIPDSMAEVGLAEFMTPSGNRVTVEDFVSGTLPKEDKARKAAIKKVEGWGGESIVKNEISLTFEKRQHNEAMALADDLTKRGYPCEVKSSIHPQTYLAFMRERLAAGDEINPEEMGLFVGRKAKLHLAKQKAGKAPAKAAEAPAPAKAAKVPPATAKGLQGHVRGAAKASAQRGAATNPKAPKARKG